MRMLQRPSGDLAYWEAGDGRPLLFIHGVGTSGALWIDARDEVIELLRATP